MEGISAAERTKQAVIFGAITGLIYMVFATCANMIITKFFLFYAVKALFYILFMLMLGLFATRIRKASGGYMSFREVFGVVFIMILVSGLLYFTYNFIYFKVIDPDFMEKIKTASLSWMEKRGMSDEALNKASADFDKRIVESKTFSLSKNLFAFVGMIIIDSLFGLIVCAVVKKNKPMFEA